MKNSKQNKKMFLEQLSKSAIVQIACEKTGISKSTIYRWRELDKEFSKAVDQAVGEGKSLVTDLAESQLISAIKDKNIPAIIYWLRHHHPTYADKLLVTHTIENEDLTPEQEALVREGLRLAKGVPMEINNVNNNNQHEQSTNESKSEQSNTSGISGGNDQGSQSKDIVMLPPPVNRDIDRLPVWKKLGIVENGETIIDDAHI